MTVEEILATKGSAIYTVDHTSTIQDAIRTMTDNKVGAIFVTKAGKIVGIWTERDLLRNTLDDAFDRKTAIVGDFMVSPVKSVKHTLDIYELMDQFLGMRLRHLPVVKKGKYIGMVSIGDCLKAVLNQRNQELVELNKIASWDYYEAWNWRAASKSKDGQIGAAYTA